jgi:hypothetical protein
MATINKDKHSSAASLLGRRGAESRWRNYSDSDKRQLQNMIRSGQTKRRREGRLPQNDNFAIANALFRLANKLAKQKQGR